jgi:hypothetical protein
LRVSQWVAKLIRHQANGVNDTHDIATRIQLGMPVEFALRQEPEWCSTSLYTCDLPPQFASAREARWDNLFRSLGRDRQSSSRTTGTPARRVKTNIAATSMKPTFINRSDTIIVNK